VGRPAGLNYLRHDIKRGSITCDEEELIIRLHKLLGIRSFPSSFLSFGTFGFDLFCLQNNLLPYSTDDAASLSSIINKEIKTIIDSQLFSKPRISTKELR